MIARSDCGVRFSACVIRFSIVEQYFAARESSSRCRGSKQCCRAELRRAHSPPPLPLPRPQLESRTSSFQMERTWPRGRRPRTLRVVGSRRQRLHHSLHGAMRSMSTPACVIATRKPTAMVLAITRAVPRAFSLACKRARQQVMTFAQVGASIKPSPMILQRAACIRDCVPLSSAVSQQ